MANVLIPTDFSTASLQLVSDALRTQNLPKSNIILFHAFAQPSSPFDLLTNDRRDPANTLLSEAFRQTCKNLKNEYPQQINKIMLRCMNGDTIFMFRNFIDANDIDLIYCPADYVFGAPHERSVDPSVLFTKSGIPVVYNKPERTGSAISIEPLPAFRLSTQ